MTSECPADHPHHASLWIGADHVHAQMPAAGTSRPLHLAKGETFEARHAVIVHDGDAEEAGVAELAKSLSEG